MGVSVTRDVEISEVEFPDEGVGVAEDGKVSCVVRKGEADLNQVEAIHVGFEHDVVRGGLRVDGIVVENGTRNGTSEIVLRPIKRQPATHYVVPTSLMTFP